MKKTTFGALFPRPWPLFFIGVIALFAAYGRLILHPDLHAACPENDTWNLPVRWSILSSLRGGHLPLWNPLSAFGIPWLATWQTEVFYPGTQFFKWFGLAFWNYSGIFHLLIFSWGIFHFLRNLKVSPFWAFFSSSIGLLNACAYNHLGSNSSMDTMAWMPWLFVATQGMLGQKKFSGLSFSLFLVLQIFAGYPQIIIYTLSGCFAYALFAGGFPALGAMGLSLSGALLLSACQWLPSIEYFFFNCVRLPAVQDNPHFFLPLENLKTFFDVNALARNGKPDYVVNPTFFYFNFYSGLLPLASLALGLFRWSRLKRNSRFFLAGFFVLVLWALGFFGEIFQLAGLPWPGFLEPAKDWVLINVFELLALGLLLEDLFPKPGKWKWGFLAALFLNLLIPIWNHPLERNLEPPSVLLEAEAQKITGHLGSGRVLILPNAQTRASLYTPLPDNEQTPLFKRFVPNSNYFASLPLATFYGSTQPSWGALNAGFYFQYVFPETSGALMDLLGVDLLYLPQDHLPAHYRKIQTDGTWTLWKNPGSMGSHFFFSGNPEIADRKSIFTAFASGRAHALQNLFLDPFPVSRPSFQNQASPAAQEFKIPAHLKDGFLVVTQNAMPGWRAWVDGRPSDIFLADGIFQGIPVKAEAQSAVLSYEPASFRLGLFLSLIGVMGLGILLGIQNFLVLKGEFRSFPQPPSSLPAR